MNIFARELAQLLAKKGKVLGSLYGLHSPTYQLLPNKVTRLRRSLNEEISATLNADELELVANWLKWEPDGNEIRRLRAALLAESVRHMLGGRIRLDQAQEMGERTFRLLLGQEPEEFLSLREELLEGIRGGITFEADEPMEVSEGGAARGFSGDESPQSGPQDAQIEPALEPAIKIYEQGALWLEVARATSDQDARLGYMAQARTLLAHAKDLATTAPSIAPDSAIRQEWLTIIGSALAEANTLS